MQGSAPYAQSFWPGDVAELIVYDRLLGDAELQRVEEYFTRKHAGLLRPSHDPAGPAEVRLSPCQTRRRSKSSFRASPSAKCL
jgi:hypothetical protein